MELQWSVAIQALAAAEAKEITVRLQDLGVVELTTRESACELELRVLNSFHGGCARPILLSFLGEALGWGARGFREALRGWLLLRATRPLLPKSALSRVGQGTDALRFEGFEAGDFGLGLNLEIDNRLGLWLLVFICLRCSGCIELLNRFELNGRGDAGLGLLNFVSGLGNLVDQHTALLNDQPLGGTHLQFDLVEAALRNHAATRGKHQLKAILHQGLRQLEIVCDCG